MAMLRLSSTLFEFIVLLYSNFIILVWSWLLYLYLLILCLYSLFFLIIFGFTVVSWLFLFNRTYAIRHLLNVLLFIAYYPLFFSRVVCNSWFVLVLINYGSVLGKHDIKLGKIRYVWNLICTWLFGTFVLLRQTY